MFGRPRNYNFLFGADLGMVVIIFRKSINLEKSLLSTLRLTGPEGSRPLLLLYSLTMKYTKRLLFNPLDPFCKSPSNCAAGENF